MQCWPPEVQAEVLSAVDNTGSEVAIFLPKILKVIRRYYGRQSFTTQAIDIRTEMFDEADLYQCAALHTGCLCCVHGRFL